VCTLTLGLSVGLAADVSVQDAYIRGMPPGQDVTAAFFQLNNTSDQDCEIVGAASPVAGSAEIHTHSHEGGMMRMRKLETLLVPKGESIAFKPGSYHLMLFGVKQLLVDGDSYPLTLLFSGCPEQTVDAEVRSVLR